MEVDSEQYKKLEKSIHGLTELHLRQFCKSSGCEYGSPAGVCHKIVEQVNIVWSDMRECAWPLFPQKQRRGQARVSGQKHCTLKKENKSNTAKLNLMHSKPNQKNITSAIRKHEFEFVLLWNNDNS